MRIVISSGHGKYVQGAVGILNEVTEARAVVESTAEFLRDQHVDITVYHDDVSKTQDENLKRIVDFHNSKTRDLDVSVHFNAYTPTSSPRGTEVFFTSSTGGEIAKEVVDAIVKSSGLINRGAKKTTSLYFLNHTEEPAILIEVCFVDSSADVDIYRDRFLDICGAIAGALSGEDIAPPDAGMLFHAKGKCSHFGGPKDMGVSPDEGLAFLYDIEDAPDLFLPFQPPGTTGLARRLDPRVHYVACRWDYNKTSKKMLASGLYALVRAKGKEFLAAPADWGPHEDTGRVADLSPGLMEALGLKTDDEVEVMYPAEEAVDEPPEVG